MHESAKGMPPPLTVVPPLLPLPRQAWPLTPYRYCLRHPPQRRRPRCHSERALRSVWLPELQGSGRWRSRRGVLTFTLCFTLAFTKVENAL